MEDDQISKLIANGKLTPKTAEALRKPASLTSDIAEGASDIFSSAKDLVGTGVNKAKDFFHEQNPDFDPSYVPSTMKDAPTQPLAGGPAPASAEGPVMAPEKADLSELAMTQQPQVQAKPMNMMGDSGMNSAFATQQAGIKGMADAQSKGLMAQGDIFNQAAKDAQVFQEQIAQLGNERKQRYEEHVKNLEASQKELEKAHEINPNRYWENKSTGSKISATIGIFLGAIGGALTGKGGNVALDIVNSAIDKDIEAQKDAYNRLKGKMADKQSAYSMAMNELGNEQAAVLAAQASGLKMTELKLKSVAAQAQSEEVRAKALMGIGALKEEQAKVGMMLNQQIQKSTALRQATTQGVEDPSILPEDVQKRVVKMPNGLYRPAISDSAAKIVNEVTIASDGMKSILKQMRDLNSPALPFDQKRALAEALKTEYILQKKTAEQLGVLSQVDKEMVESTLGNPGGWRPGRTDALIDLAEKNLEKKLNSTYTTYVPGYKPLTKMAPR
jgi:hypothetical protein